MCKIAVIVPAFNEEKTVGKVIEAFHRELPEAQIVVIDNASTDATGAVARATLWRMGAGGHVIDEARRGKGSAVRRAFLEVDADVYVLVDADMTYPAQQVRELLRPVQAGEVDMVVGDRFTRQQYLTSTRRPMHSFGNRLVRQLVNALFRASLLDVMSGYRVLSRRFVKTYPVLAEGFQVETEMTLHALDKRFRVMEVPVDYFARPLGSKSKLGTVSDGARVLGTIIRTLRHYRPLAFFATISALAGVVGMLTAASVLQDWLRYRNVWHVPLAALAVSLGSIALVSMGIGLVLDWMAYQQKMNFERELLQARMSDATRNVAEQPPRRYARAV